MEVKIRSQILYPADIHQLASLDTRTDKVLPDYDGITILPGTVTQKWTKLPLFEDLEDQDQIIQTM